jgi:hypothetical protein
MLFVERRISSVHLWGKMCLSYSVGMDWALNSFGPTISYISLYILMLHITTLSVSLTEN